MTSVAALPVLAAGAVCWRVVDGKVQVLLVHRTQHKDVSLPKGKLDPGETLPETAVREIAEETGLNIALGAPLGRSVYPLPGGREKKVFYWAAEVDDAAVASSTFTPNHEIADLEWASIARARKKVSYSHDQAILDTFAARVEAGTARTFSVTVLRHAKTVPGETWDGPDATRPLLRRGADQARSVAQGLAAYRPKRIYTSTAARCVATIAPVARITAVRVKQTETLSQDLHELGQADVQHFTQKPGRSPSSCAPTGRSSPTSSQRSRTSPAPRSPRRCATPPCSPPASSASCISVSTTRPRASSRSKHTALRPAEPSAEVTALDAPWHGSLRDPAVCRARIPVATRRVGWQLTSRSPPGAKVDKSGT
jgi:8-oxo-dGTP pyrophosphatase MutT (NUDIX family)